MSETSAESAGEERVRLFVALELPGRVRAALEEWGKELAGGDRALRPVAREDLHVTLCFLGSRDAGQVAGIVEALQPPPDARAPELVLEGGIWLPPRGPRVLAVGLRDPSQEASRLQAHLARALEVGGWYEPSTRPFLAHVTLARVRHGARPRPRRRGPLPPIEPLRFRAATMTLFRSRLSPSGARYDPLSRLSLAAG
jgi:RNA 2',3'-cyclic 3'-phosphodiesterase